jgi:hypothetical protein
MLHGDLSPLKKTAYLTFPRFRDLGTLRKCPQIAGDSMRDSGTCWPSPRHSEQISGTFRTDFGDVLGRFQCYPRYLGITRRSCLEAHMVLDMEYREQERLEHGPGGPIFFFSARLVLPAVPASITTGLGLHQKRLLLHEVIGPRYHGMCHI